MGQSNSSYQTQQISELNSTIFNALATFINSSSQVCGTKQTFNLVLGPTGVINCPPGTVLTIGQTSAVNCNLSAQFNTNTTNNVTNIINSAISALANSQQTATQQFLATGLQQNVSNLSLIERVTNDITTNITTAVTNSCISQATADQNSNITINGTINGCATFSQDARISAISNCLTNNVVSVLANDSTISAIANATGATQTATQQGIFSLFSGTTGIIVAIIVVAIVIAIIYWLYSSNKSQNPPAGANGAATQPTTVNTLLTPQNAELALKLAA